MALSGTKTKSPLDLVKSLSESLNQIDSVKGTEYKKVSEDASKALQAIKTMLCGTADQEPLPENQDMVFQGLTDLSGCLVKLVENLSYIDFEGRKNTVSIFHELLQGQIGLLKRVPIVDYIADKGIMYTLAKGYEYQEISLNCGMMLRDCLQEESLVNLLMDSDCFYQFFQYVEVSTSEIASDAFSTFRTLLTRHTLMSAEFLEINYDKFFSHYQTLLNSENYDTRGQALKLLAEIMLNRHYFTIMNRYLSNPENLKLMMNMLRETSRNVQFEAFHVFKMFVLKPNKAPPILDILLRDKDNLVEFLSEFQTDRSEDQQFNFEKTVMIEHMKELKPQD